MAINGQKEIYCVILRLYRAILLAIYIVQKETKFNGSLLSKFTKVRNRSFYLGQFN